MLATASAVSRANMATSDWLRRFDFDRLFWSTPAEVTNGGGDGVSIKLPATQQCVYDGLGERIVEDVLNVSASILDDQPPSFVWSADLRCFNGLSSPPIS